ncbi:hypothetical protein [Candidatus Lokiarchaeum ossiferum]|uniref:hypothetical protein n=1 Tax=Candidatus Lokiarchaeum ossiferum TaxID=2951803 RepID=UPI00352ED067
MRERDYLTPTWRHWVSIRVMNTLIVASFLQYVALFIAFTFFNIGGIVLTEPNQTIAITELILSVILIPCIIWRLRLK